MSRYPNPLYDQFMTELNLQLKPSKADIKIRPQFSIWCDRIPNKHNMKFQLILRWFAYGSLRIVFLQQN